MDVFESQYELIQRTRESLFRYCETLSPADYVKEVETFGGVSIRSLHAHVADCYRVWLGNRALGKSLPKVKPESVDNVQKMREVFKKTDALVYDQSIAAAASGAVAAAAINGELNQEAWQKKTNE